MVFLPRRGRGAEHLRKANAETTGGGSSLTGAGAVGKRGAFPFHQAARLYGEKYLLQSLSTDIVLQYRYGVLQYKSITEGV